MIMWYTIIVALAILGTSLVVAAQEDSKYGLDTAFPGASCADIYNKNLISHGRSGYYVLKTDKVFIAYCDMELECGGIKGGWMRVANINKGDTCPTGWTSEDSYCTGDSNPAAGCYSAHFPTNSTSYNRVCGKALGYQKRSMDAFRPSISSRSLDEVYVDGISITTGNPRKHVWTYAARASDDKRWQNYNCPCAKYPGPDPPVFVGSHYYCATGTTGELLWNGKCGRESYCCYNAGMPWFFRQFPTAITGDFEVRMCRDQVLADEGISIMELQLYIQ